MSAPTREQECKHEHIKTWVFEDTKEPAMWSCAYCGLKFAPEMATLTAGREQGLSDAAARVRAILADCDARDVDDPEIEQIAQAIEQLKASA